MPKTFSSLSLGITAFAASAAFAAAPQAHAEKYASIVVDMDTGEVLHSRHADALRYPASLTKVMTLYMVFDELEAGRMTLDQRLSVSRNAANASPSKLGLRPGSTIRVSDAINALITKSANDAAVVIAENIGGSESRFAQLMTTKAATLGLTSTTFRNASGLPNSLQRSTARDMAILAEAVMRDHAGYYHYFSEQKFAYGGRTYKNHNELLGKVKGVDGIKTGYTRASGFNLMASAHRDGRRVIAVMLGGQTSKSRNAHVEQLIEAAFDAIEENDAKNPLMAERVFDSVVAPNDAAIPVLNGKPFSVAAADTKAAPPAPKVITTTIKPEAEAPAPVVTAAITPAPSTPTAKPEVNVIEPVTTASAPSLKPATAAFGLAKAAPAPSAKIIDVAAASTPSTPSTGPIGIAAMSAKMPLTISVSGGMSISEYEAAQLSK